MTNIMKGKTPRLPEFIIPGAQRSGTTTFYRKLVQHPEIGAAVRKEVHYFDLRSGRSIDWYKSMFPPREDAKITGDASPYYLPHPLCAKRIANALPDVKILVLLRNPVDRAYSHFCHSVRGKQETLNFEDAIKAEESRLEGSDEWFADNPKAGFHGPHNHFSYLLRGRYYEQLEEWFELFEGRIKIVRSEDYFQLPQMVLQDVAEWLGVEDTEFEFDTSWDKPSGYINEPIDYVVHQYLVEYFRPHNARLQEAIGVPMDWEGRPYRITFKCESDEDVEYEPDETELEWEALTAPSSPE